MEQHPSTTDLGAESATICVELPLVSGEAEVETLGGELGYAATDPYAVTLRVHTRRGPVAWTFARELLARGRYEPAGDGDVMVWPCLSVAAEAVTVIELHAPDGEAMLQASSRELDGFLAATYRVVPEGDEGAHLGLDALIGQLLLGS